VPLKAGLKTRIGKISRLLKLELDLSTSLEKFGERDGLKLWNNEI
jgi:hypothetical protein